MEITPIQSYRKAMIESEHLFFKANLIKD